MLFHCTNGKGKDYHKSKWYAVHRDGLRSLYSNQLLEDLGMCEVCADVWFDKEDWHLVLC